MSPTHRTRAAFWALAGREAVAQLHDEHAREALARERSAQVRARVRARLAVYAAGHVHLVTSNHEREGTG